MLNHSRLSPFISLKCILSCLLSLTSVLFYNTANIAFDTGVSVKKCKLCVHYWERAELVERHRTTQKDSVCYATGLPARLLKMNNSKQVGRLYLIYSHDEGPFHKRLKGYMQKIMLRLATVLNMGCLDATLCFWNSCRG